jgi:hypothetical protein
MEYPKKSDIFLIRRLGEETAGQALLKYMRAVVESGTQGFLTAKASDVESIAKSQGGIYVARQVIDLLTGDPQDLVSQYAFDEEEGEEDAS